MTREPWPPWRRQKPPAEPLPAWRQEIEDADTTSMGRPPETRRQAVVKLLWVGLWLLYLGAPVSDLTGGHHGAAATTAAALGLGVFVAGYLVLVFFRTNHPGPPERWVHLVLVGETALALALPAALGKDWLVLLVYVAVACGAALSAAESRWAVPGVVVLLAAMGGWKDPGGQFFASLLVPALLGGFAMMGVKQLVHTMRELREARQTVAHLAATEERLRLARDLHDLLGHSLSLITLKSELAGRMLPDRPTDAAEQVADIERVSRQALVDVREAVSGYRRPTLAAEAAAARSALASAGIEARFHLPERVPGLDPDGEGALAWALREAATNVVRHSGAAVCVAALAAADGAATLTVSDDGRGPAPDHAPGNGLTGLGERIMLAGGTLATARSGDGGFTVRATVPLSATVVGVTREGG
ncbi:sensor histidine kinase [Actinacidiphila guanduensis]|uniref:Two-component system, NarL family, sensor histidine kinase DesK n=1 Tax=Actinacidiphila guanduensis TaxID=310781 RepID=A0A1H0A5T1_9ACTN|nr:histidine kinase [Actinacidiphila guanduensis]SDN28584.1 two-component system, NarL family, sensor histidine kinase DesK [Actinacidiphila guanduensis]